MALHSLDMLSSSTVGIGQLAGQVIQVPAQAVAQVGLAGSHGNIQGTLPADARQSGRHFWCKIC
jgi:hypothetical protein